MGYSRLPEPEQQALVRQVAGGLESGFAARDLRAAAERELTEVLENRREDVAGGAGTVDAVSTMAAREIQELHADLDQRPGWRSTEQDPIARFAPGHDPATPGFGAVASPAGSPAAKHHGDRRAAQAARPRPLMKRSPGVGPGGLLRPGRRRRSW